MRTPGTSWDRPCLRGAHVCIYETGAFFVLSGRMQMGPIPTRHLCCEERWVCWYRSQLVWLCKGSGVTPQAPWVEPDATFIVVYA